MSEEGTDIRAEMAWAEARTKMATHTPTPWVLWSEEGQTKTGRYRNSVCYQAGELGTPREGKHVCVADVLGDSEDESRENALLVVEAVNSHDALVSALADALDEWEGYNGSALDNAAPDHWTRKAHDLVLKAVA